jgi:hypothetical protein
MSLKRFSILLLVLVSISIGCVAPSLVQLGHHVYPPKSADYDMPVFIGEDKVDQTYMEVCVFVNNSQTQMDGQYALSIVDYCKPAARKAGCDALLLEDADVDGADLNPAGRNQQHMAVIKGIKFVDSSDYSRKEDSTELLYLHVK